MSASERDDVQHLVGHDVVLDTRGELLLYIGRLERATEWFFELVEADVHDLTATRTSKELYVMEAAKYGVKKNRKSVMVRKVEVVSISRLTDVIQY